MEEPMGRRCAPETANTQQSTLCLTWSCFISHLEPYHMGDLHPVEEALDLGDPTASSNWLEE